MFSKLCSTRRIRFLIILLFMFSIFYIYTNDNHFSKSQILTISSSSLNVSYSNIEQHSRYRLILLWTDLFQDVYWHLPMFFNSSSIISCSSVHKCEFTRDKNRLFQASSVAFHLYDIKRYELPLRVLPQTIDQNWIFITGESPVNFYYQNPTYNPYVLDGYFDQVISYKFDSAYSIFAQIIDNRTLLSTKLEQTLNFESLKLKTKSIAWIVSNCITFSQREKYVKELEKYIDVDIYGKCGKICSRESSNGCQIDLSQYYFYLSFENSRCKSYITEKFWNILTNNTHRLVPIVMGANKADYELAAPKNSYIHVNDYKTPRDLAQYLHYLMNNPEEYLSYLQWREHTMVKSVIPQRWHDLLCPICQMAYENHSIPYSRINFSSWYNPQSECNQDDVKMLTKCKQVNLRSWMSWLNNIDCP